MRCEYQNGCVMQKPSAIHFRGQQQLERTADQIRHTTDVKDTAWLGQQAGSLQKKIDTAGKQLATAQPCSKCPYQPN